MTDEQLARALHGGGAASIQTLQYAAQQRGRGENLARVLLRLELIAPEVLAQYDPATAAWLAASGQGAGQATAAPEEDVEIGLGADRINDAGGEIVYSGEEDGGYDPAQAPVVRWTSELIRVAVSMGASDMHLEPRANGLLPRYRVDGQLRSGNLLPVDLILPVTSRLKVLSGIDITETRMPQDGRFRASFGDRVFDFRVSTLPGLHGEKVVLRLLDRTSLVTDLVRLGFTPDARKLFESMLRRSHGMILVTGPTGSGKTTTLYAALASAQDTTKNVITIEDPVEYELEGVNQTPVQVEIGLTFAAVLRSVLRQDPDVILVGEIRDNDTADIAVRAALTGHLLLSTLHTNSAVGAVTRLQDMGVPPYLIASALTGVLAQRLVRMNCRNCKAVIPDDDPERIEAIDVLKLEPDAKLYRGKGCEKCNNSGYKGRVGIMEILSIDGELRRAIQKWPTMDELKAVAIATGFKTLWQDGREKLLAGITSPTEVMRALLGHDE